MVLSYSLRLKISMILIKMKKVWVTINNKTSIYIGFLSNPVARQFGRGVKAPAAERGDTECCEFKSVEEHSRISWDISCLSLMWCLRITTLSLKEELHKVKKWCYNQILNFLVASSKLIVNGHRDGSSLFELLQVFHNLTIKFIKL